MIFHAHHASYAVVLVLFFMTATLSPVTIGNTGPTQNQLRQEGIDPTLHIDHLSTTEVYQEILSRFSAQDLEPPLGTWCLLG